MGQITVVGLGPGNGRFLTRSAWELLSDCQTLYLRTRQHPTVDELPDTISLKTFDDLYDTADSFEDVYQLIVSSLLEAAAFENVVYAVPGHPFVGESTVTRLVEEAAVQGIEVIIEPGISFIESVLTAVRQDALDGLQIFDALELVTKHIPPISPDLPVMISQVFNRLVASELKLVLMTIYPDDHELMLVHGADTQQMHVDTIPLYELDHSDATAHLSTLYIPPLPYPASLTALAETVAILRSPDGCPWDQEQTPQSMRSGFLEEACEVLEALDEEDSDNLAEELGDMFYHLIMQIQMATEDESFRLTDVLAGIDAKLKRRHPHVWGDVSVADSNEVVMNWEAIKEQEKGEQREAKSLIDHIPEMLPALARSQKIQDRVRKVGFDWPNIDGVYAKLEEEVGELKTAVSPEEKLLELGDVLFVVANIAKWLGIDAESALREANLRFGKRFREVEKLSAEQELPLDQATFDQLEALWQAAKKRTTSA